MRWLTGIVLTVLLASVFVYLTQKSDQYIEPNLQSRLVGNKTVIVNSKFINLKNSLELNPSPNQDFAVLIWFNIKSKISNGDKVAIAEKFDSDAPNKPGWAVRITNHKKIYRPEVYWNNPAGSGRWYSFSEFPFKEDRWFGLLLSYKKGQYLGLKGFQLEKGKKPENFNLGGYFLPGIYPTNSASLKVGSVGNIGFNGSIGKIYLGEGLLNKDWEQRIQKACQNLSESESFCIVK